MKKRNETFKKKKKLTSFEQCAYLYSTGSNQTNHWRLAVYNAVSSEKKKQADISKLIRRSKGPKGWDGVCQTDKVFRSIQEKVRLCLKTLSYDGGLDAAELNRHGATHIIIRKTAKMEKRRKINASSIQETMEKELMSVLIDMRNKTTASPEQLYS